MRHLVRPLLALLALVVAVAATPGCGGKKKGTMVPNAPPETFLFVQGQVDPVNHRVRLYWNGSDPDGDVTAFEFRMFNDQLPADTQWVRRAADDAGYDSLFTIYSPSGLSDVRFEVRSIDDDGAADPTPATERFQFTNGAPTIAFTSAPAANDSTYGSVTVSWSILDPDGGGPGLRSRVWLNGDETAYDSTSATTFTVPSARFYRAGRWMTGRCTLSVRAVDDGGRVGPANSVSWIVRAPYPADPTRTRGRILLIDDLPGTAQNNFTVDTLYANTLNRNLPAGSWSLLQTQFNRPFRSAADLAQTFRQFDAVVWYRGFQTASSDLLVAYADSVFGHTANGGRLYLETLYLFAGLRSPGWVDSSFVGRYLGGSALARWSIPNPPDSSIGWGNRQNGRLRSSLFADSLSFAGVLAAIPGETGGVRAFMVPDTSLVALWARPNALAPSNPAETALALRVPQPGGGLIMVVPFPIRIGLPPGPSRVLAKLLFDPVNGLLGP